MTVLLPIEPEDWAHCHEWFAKLTPALEGNGEFSSDERSRVQRSEDWELGHLGEYLLARDLDAEHRCVTDFRFTDDPFDLCAQGRRIEVKTKRHRDYVFEGVRDAFRPGRFDHLVVMVLRGQEPGGSLEVLGFTDPVTFAHFAREGIDPRLPGRLAMDPWHLGRYEVLVDILFTPELAGAAELNGRPWVGCV